MRAMEERRYHGLDALRGVMMMLGIVVHAAVLYIADAPPHLPFTSDPNRSIVMDRVVDFIHAFRMPVFFVLAGFFAALLVEKRGLWGTYRNRAARILGPLVAGMLTVVPVALVFMLGFVLAVRYGHDSLVPDMALLQRLEREMAERGVPSGIFLGHLWFLYYLLYFYLLLPLCRFIGPRTRIPSPMYVLPVMALVTAATLWPFPGSQVFGEFVFLKPYVPGLVYYGQFFVFGYVLHSNRGFLDALARNVVRHALLAAVLFPLSVYASHAEYASGGAFDDRLRTVVIHGFSTWALSFFFVGAAMRFFDRPSPWILYTSQSAYWVFLLHMPVVCALAWWLLPYDLPALVKFAVITVVTVIVCFTTYHYWVQRTWVSVFLNGKRFDLPWPWRAATSGTSLLQTRSQ